MLSVSLIAPDSTPSIRYSYPIAILRGSAALAAKAWMAADGTTAAVLWAATTAVAAEAATLQRDADLSALATGMA